MRSILRSMLAVATALSVTACGAAATTPPPNTGGAAPPADTPTAPPPPPAGDPFAVNGTLKDEALPLLKPAPFDAKAAVYPPAPIGLPPAPGGCDAFAKRAPVAAPACADRAAALAALDGALSEADAGKRDARLAGVEACAGIEAGLVRALRAELAPTECADALHEPILKAPPAGLGGDSYHVLLGQTIAARLARTALEPPRMTPPYDKKRVLEFTKGPLATWMTDQARAIEDLGRLGVQLPFYAKGIVAVEAGMADMRLVEAVRASPLPESMAKDEDVKNVYYSMLDQALEPWKTRGRDAALVGLRELSSVGVVSDRRVDAARAMLSRLYGGRRIDALDALMLPPAPAAPPASVEERLAAALPTYYAGRLLPPDAGVRPATLRAMLARGVPLPQRAALKGAELPPEVRELYARARIDLGRAYWRAVDFDQAAALLTPWPFGVERSPEATFLLAIALGLRNGPEDAALMMRRAPLAALGLGEITALDWVARSKPASPYAGAAAFDAALIKQLSAPQGADAAYWTDVAARYREARGLLTGAAAQAADDRAKAADEIAKAIH